MAAWQAGISPLELAACLADLDGVLVADGLEVRFVCGPAAAQVVREHPQVSDSPRVPAPVQSQQILHVPSQTLG
jgi:hypothetical protein